LRFPLFALWKRQVRASAHTPLWQAAGKPFVRVVAPIEWQWPWASFPDRFPLTFVVGALKIEKALQPGMKGTIA
jgi:hypothetical protein